MNKSKIRIAIQKKGRLKEDSLNYLQKLGLKFNLHTGREMVLACKNADVEFLFVRNSDIPEYVRWGAADFGIVGENVLNEKGKKWHVVKKLGFGRCQVVIAAPKRSDMKVIADLQDERIATSHPAILREFLNNHDVTASVIVLKGSVEIAPALNLADAICDITQTGETLRAHDLKPLATILTSEALLIAGKPNKSEKDIFNNLK